MSSSVMLCFNGAFEIGLSRGRCRSRLQGASRSNRPSYNPGTEDNS